MIAFVVSVALAAIFLLTAGVRGRIVGIGNVYYSWDGWYNIFIFGG